MPTDDLKYKYHNRLQQIIDISSYNTLTNPYTFPDDGFLISNNATYELFGSNYGQRIYSSHSFFVLKGMKVYKSSSSGTILYLPLS